MSMPTLIEACLGRLVLRETRCQNNYKVALSRETGYNLQHMFKRTPLVFLFCAFVALSLGTGCSKFKKSSEKVIATVNGYPLYDADLKRALALRARTDPHFKITPATLDIEMDNLIDNRLLIAEAQKMDLDKKVRFADTIKTFWEQTLIRELLSAKNAEFDRDIGVTPDEVREYYDRLGFEVTFKIIRRKDREPLEKILGMAEDLVAWQDVVGPVNYLEIKSSILREAFDLKAGESKIFEDGDFHYLVFLAQKSEIPAPGLDDVRAAIEKKIKRNKQNAALRGWLDDLKNRSDIEIFNDALKAESPHAKD